MAFLTRLEDYSPPVREASESSWVAARMEETSDPVSGVVTTILAQAALNPAVIDNENPPTYTFESDESQYANGWYRIVWVDENALEQPTRWLRKRELPYWAPSIQDVADHILQRTVEKGGHFAGTFTDKTRPDRDTVERVLAKAVDRVQTKLAQFGDPPTGNMLDEAQDLAALRAAMLIELMFYSEQIETDRSPYRHLKELWDDSWAAGTDNVTEDIAEIDTTPNKAAFWFPEANFPEIL